MRLDDASSPWVSPNILAKHKCFRSLPPAAHLRAFTELSRIAGTVSMITYRQTDRQGASSELDKALEMLEDWRHALPAFLQLSKTHLTSDPACCTLHMRYNQLIIVATRSLFYTHIKDKSLQVGTGCSTELPDQLKRCIAAAEANILLPSHYMALVDDHRPIFPIGGFMFASATCLILGDLVWGQNAIVEERFSRLRKVDYVIALFKDFEQTSEYGGASFADLLQYLRDLRTNHATRPLPVSSSGLGHPALQTGAQDLPSTLMNISQDTALFEELVTWMGENWPTYG